MSYIRTLIRKAAGLPLDRIGTVCLWSAAVWGLLLLMDALITLAHIVLLSLVFVVLVLCHTVWQKKAARVLARVLTALPAAAVMLLSAVSGVLSAVDGVEVLRILQPVCIVGLPVLCWVLPALTTLRNRGGRYDAWALRLCGLWLLGLIGVAAFTAVVPAEVWRWDVPLLRYVWLLLAAVGWLLSWLPTRKKAAEPRSAAKGSVL